MTLANSFIQIFISEFKPIMHAELTWPPLAGLGLGDEKGKMPVIQYSIGVSVELTEIFTDSFPLKQYSPLPFALTKCTRVRSIAIYKGVKSYINGRYM